MKTVVPLEELSDDQSLTKMARTCEAAERYEDMCACMLKLVKLKSGNGLAVEERNLLSVAYKNVVGARRASWRVVNQEVNNSASSQTLPVYKRQIEEELEEICNEILNALKSDLIVQGECDEAQVFYLKMGADYYRYLAEAITNNSEYKTQASDMYSQAYEIAKQKLTSTSPVRLGLALNYSVCLYEIVKEQDKACTMAKEAFDAAISELDKLEETDYKDSTLIMQLLRDNLTLWTSADNDEEDLN